VSRRRLRVGFGRVPVGFLLLLLAGAAGCGDSTQDGASVEVTVPEGANLSQVADTLQARGLIGRPGAFGLWARFRGDDTRIRSGRYALTTGSSWSELLDALTAGAVVTVPVTLPEGWTLAQMAPRLAAISAESEEEVRLFLARDSAHLEHGLPGPGLEGYLFPDTYRFAEGTGIQRIVEAMVAEYNAFWTLERRAQLDSLGLTEGEVVTLASIVQAEARAVDEMPTIASVYHNRVRDGWLLQADPTVLYALGGTRERLLFAAMDSVADHPYNTYTQPGLPPGPIGAPGAAALEAALNPPETEFFFFVSDAEGRHVFSRTLAEHNRAVAEYRRRQSTGRPDLSP